MSTLPAISAAGNLLSLAIREADLRAYATAGRPLPSSEHRRLVAVREARVLERGRVVALVDHAPAASANPNAITTDLVTLTPRVIAT